MPEKQELIKNYGTIKTPGLNLTTAEDKIMNALYELLSEKSENKDINSSHFYSGNFANELIKYGKEELVIATIRIKPADLYRKYLGKDKYSGKEIINIKNVLKNLSENKYLIQYNKQRFVKKGKKEELVTDRIELYEPLIQILSYFEALTDKEVNILDNGDASFREQRADLIIAFHPVLTDQINSKYIEYPSGINQKTSIASGGERKVTKSIIALRDYLMRELSYKRYSCEIDEKTLIYQLRLQDFLKNGRSKRLAQRIEEAIEVSKKLGLILEVKKTLGAKGQLKYIFTLNPDFE